MERDREKTHRDFCALTKAIRREGTDTCIILFEDKNMISLEDVCRFMTVTFLLNTRRSDEGESFLPPKYVRTT